MGQGPATAPLDAAARYVRVRGLRVLPAYVLGMIPMSVLALLLIDALSAQHRSVVAGCCAALVPATLWRWGWLARVQQIVQQDTQARPGLPLGPRLAGILLVRLYANVALTWGGALIFPSFYGLFAGSFAAPLRLERDGPLLGETWRMLGLVHHAAGRLTCVLAAVAALGLALAVAILTAHYVVVGLILPSVLGVDTTGAILTMGSISWKLSVLYFLFLFLDYSWTIAAVFLYYDSQSRRTGSDLRARLHLLTGGESR
jgi:hypothetical protein